ncbi:unnamed protein product [Peronospora belbahrii]|uniref:arabinogalactan endo-beta-1,4-galactanase n=1 Tax=Peronospora belbahrii TaxID=622444 RepID=A0AAU9LAC1_9STRA|nr:unnamed protein product [Peronospora belbahrii]
MLTKILFLIGVYTASMFNVAEALTKGHDLSFVTLMETKQGANWIPTSGKHTSIESILGAGGMDTVRLRLWTSGDYDLDYTLALAQRPFTAGGVKLTILSLGNKIAGGFLFPMGKINGDFKAFATLWKAARQGVTDAVSAGTSRPKVMIHLENGWNSNKVLPFFKGLFAEGTVTQNDVDAFGFSFYPFYNTEGNTCRAQVFSNGNGQYLRHRHLRRRDQLADEVTKVKMSADFPVSAEGQVAWVAAIIDILERLPNKLGAGIFNWEPGYLSVAGLGSSCESALLFSVNWDKWPETDATALSSVTMFA